MWFESYSRKHNEAIHEKKSQLFLILFSLNLSTSWDFFGRNDAEAETLVLWPPHAKSWLVGKDSDAGRDWGQEEKGMTEDEMAGWHHWLDECEFEWTPGVGDGHWGLACYNSWGHKKSDTTEQLNWTESFFYFWLYFFGFLGWGSSSEIFRVQGVYECYHFADRPGSHSNGKGDWRWGKNGGKKCNTEILHILS